MKSGRYQCSFYFAKNSNTCRWKIVVSNWPAHLTQFLRFHVNYFQFLLETGVVREYRWVISVDHPHLVPERAILSGSLEQKPNLTSPWYLLSSPFLIWRADKISHFSPLNAPFWNMRFVKFFLVFFFFAHNFCLLEGKHSSDLYLATCLSTWPYRNLFPARSVLLTFENI